MPAAIKVLVLYLLFSPCWSHAQTGVDYSNMQNWYVHPNKFGSILNNYALDIAVIDENLTTDSIIVLPNNATTNTGVDVFFVHPTHLINPPTQPTVVPIDSQAAGYITGIVVAQAGLLARYGRLYAPKYRQSTPAAFLSRAYDDSTRAAAILQTYGDVKAAFLEYLHQHSNGNRIILAGHSQGAFLLSMLLHDVFDADPALRARLVTAALGGTPIPHAAPAQYQGGWWVNIPLCTQSNQCGCIHTWRCFKHNQTRWPLNRSLPAFNPVLVDSGLVHQVLDLNTNHLMHDSLYYDDQTSPLRFYITPDASYQYNASTNFIAFDGIYSARYDRSSPTSVALVLDHLMGPTDQRPNELLQLEQTSSFIGSGYHNKDYHIYLWALMEQINDKLAQCSPLVLPLPLKPLTSPLRCFPILVRRVILPWHGLALWLMKHPLLFTTCWAVWFRSCPNNQSRPIFTWNKPECIG